MLNSFPYFVFYVFKQYLDTMGASNDEGWYRNHRQGTPGGDPMNLSGRRIFKRWKRVADLPAAAGGASSCQRSPRRNPRLSPCLLIKSQQCRASAIYRLDRPSLRRRPLNQLTMLVTAEGSWVLPDSEEFLAALGDPHPDYDAVGFAIRNLGFIKFQVLDRLVTEIELPPRNVDRRALLAVERLLHDADTNLFRIKYLEDEWLSE